MTRDVSLFRLRKQINVFFTQNLTWPLDDKFSQNEGDDMYFY